MAQTEKPARIKLGIVGGGRDAFIGGVHRIASRIDDHYELVAGAFSSTIEKSKLSGRDIGIDEDRSYGSYKEMAIREATTSVFRLWRGKPAPEASTIAMPIAPSQAGDAVRLNPEVASVRNSSTPKRS